MYAKVLNNGGPLPVPMLLMTASEGNPLIDQLHARGWAPYAGHIREDDGAEIRIMPDHLSVVIEEQVLFHDAGGNPKSPPGWWEAASAFGDRVLVVILPDGFPLTTDDMGAALGNLVGSPITAQCFVTVVHT
ncbi:hypothetical protein [Microbacterium shaanxiense]